MEYFWPFLLFCITMSITPGPNNIMLLTSSMNFGVRKTLPGLAGVAVGLTLFSVVLVLGLDIIFLWCPWIQQIIQIVGAGYLLYLASQIAVSHTKVNKKKMNKPFSFLKAFLFQWINPKAWVSWMSAVSAYSSPSLGDEGLELLVMSVARFCVITVCCGLWVLGGAQLSKLFKNDRYQARFNYVMAVLLALSVPPLFF